MKDGSNLNILQYNKPYESKEEPTPEIKTHFRAIFRDFYDRDSTQICVSVIIVLNGLLYIVQTTIWTDNCCVHNSDAQELVDFIDFGFLLLYTFELSLNFYAHFFWEFWRKTKWNWFDFAVILASWFLIENLAVIRLLRSLRLVRISGRFGALEFIIKTLRRSMTSVATLLGLLVCITLIYAILGVGLFGEVSENFEDFFTALWTLFITLSGESWPDFAEPLIDEFWYTRLYFGTFIITESLIVLNMIIAVFIQKTAEVLNEQKNGISRKSFTGNLREEFELLPIPDYVVEKDESVDFNLKEVKLCIFVLFGWEDLNVMSTSECRNGVNLILTSNGLISLARPIREGKVQLVRSLVRTMMDNTKN